MNGNREHQIERLMRERILVLDGAMGSMIQCSCNAHDHTEQLPLADFLVETDPELIKGIHRQYLEAGADIIETDSFNCNRFSLADYGREDDVYALSRKAAETARSAADEYTAITPDKPRFVAGSVGPTKHMLTLAESDSDICFDSLAATYKQQINGLLDGGADLILLETVFDTLTVKSALYALEKIREERGERIPVIISGTVANTGGRLLSGQTIEAFYASIRNALPIAAGLNCGFGSEQILPFMRRLSEIADTATALYPNAGLPDNCGEYHEDPATFAKNMEECLKEGLVNIAGGCCGTTPAHIEALTRLVAEYTPRRIPKRKQSLILSNLEYADIGASEELIQIGERTNVAGSAKFARLIREKNFDEALEVAAKQVRAGARIIDVCMDDGMEDAVGNITKFIRMLNADEETGGVPVMIDSSDWNVIENALKVNQGKSIVNSISLKEGEEEFLRRASEIRRLGAAAMVMLFDERGQADTYERKIEIAERAYRLLTDNGFDPADIIFDPNVLTVGSGMQESDMVAVDFIRATEWIKENLPYASVSGGISNLSFAFRGNNPLREAMHTIFIFHAAKAGLDMAIVNAGMLSLYDDIEAGLIEKIEDLILCRKENAVADLIAYAQNEKRMEQGAESAEQAETSLSLEARIASSIRKGKDKEIGSLMEEALKEHSPIEIIETLLMPQMKKVGQLFGEGKMFLPQVIKSAQAMKRAVEVMKPFMDSEKDSRQFDRKVIIATVKGDVHDIGKNIVSLVVSCNGYEVVDLGVRAEESVIVEMAKEISPEAILLSGLISPSLNEMIKVCKELERQGLDLPVIIGGAATSEMHTAVRIAPEYSGAVFYSSDASENLRILSSLSEETIAGNRERQAELRKIYEKGKIRSEVKPIMNKCKDVSSGHKATERPKELKRMVYNEFPTHEIESLIDWEWLLHSFDLNKNISIETETKESVREKVLKDAKAILNKIIDLKALKIEGVAEIFEAKNEGDGIVIREKDGEETSLPMLRAERGADNGLSVADFISPKEDYIVLFAVTAGKGLEQLTRKFEEAGDYYNAFLSKLVADRLAEAFAVKIHNEMSKYLWQGEKQPDGIRIAFGYPSAPDHTLKRDAFRLLDVEKETSMRLTENSMIVPSESVCGFIIRNGRYINVGKISLGQLEKYAGKRGITIDELKAIIPNNVR